MPRAVHPGQQLLPIGQRAELVHDVLVIADVVAVVVVGRFVDRREPDDIDAQRLEVIQLLDDAAQVADAVAVAVVKAARVDLVDDAFFPPGLLHKRLLLVRESCPYYAPNRRFAQTTLPLNHERCLVVIDCHQNTGRQMHERPCRPVSRFRGTGRHLPLR